MPQSGYTPSLEVKWQGETVLSLEGELDLATVPLLQAELAGVSDELTLDLRGVTFIDSLGLGTLVQLQNDIGVLNVIVSEQGPVLKVINLMQLDQVLNVTSRPSPPQD